MQGMQVQVRLRSKTSWASEREISCEIDHTESSERSETVRVGSERFFSLSLERQRSAGEIKWPVSADTHRHPCWTDSKSFENPHLVWTGMWNLQRRSNGERQTNRARMKTATHGADEGPITDLQKSVQSLRDARQKLNCESATG